MFALDLRVLDVGGDPPFPELSGVPIFEMALTKMCVMENGTLEGNPTLVVFLEREGHQIVCFQTSAKILDMVQAVIAGSVQRWKERDDGKNKEK